MPLFLCFSNLVSLWLFIVANRGGGACLAPSETRELNGACGPRCPQQPPGGPTGARKQSEESSRSQQETSVLLFRGKEAFIRGLNQCSVILHHLFRITLVVTACYVHVSVLSRQDQ